MLFYQTVAVVQCFSVQADGQIFACSPVMISASSVMKPKHKRMRFLSSVAINDALSRIRNSLLFLLDLFSVVTVSCLSGN